MTLPVSLRSVVDEMQGASSELHTYLNTVSGEILTIAQEYLDAAEREDALHRYSDWEQELVQQAHEVLASPDYVELPNQFDIHEYDIMQEFCQGVKNPKTRANLLDLIEGSGAFRRFKTALPRYNLNQDWYKFKDQSYKRIAIEWLESRGIAYQDDLDEQ